MKTTCEHIEEWMDWQVAGWADAEQVRAVEEHVAECATCREQARLMGLLAEAIAEEEAGPGAGAVDWRPDTSSGSGWLRWAVAAAACLLVVFWVNRSELRVDVAGGGDPASDLMEVLSEAPPTWGTYAQALALPDDDAWLAVVDAHEQKSVLYEEPKTLFAMRGELEGILR